VRGSGSTTPRRLSWLPQSRAGRRALWLFAVSVAALLVMAAASVERSSVATFERDPVLAVCAAVAALSGTASAVLGGYAILRHERALLVFLATAASLNVLAYAIGEALRAG
jgi:CHASE2 domain-containing sensor protein